MESLRIPRRFPRWFRQGRPRGFGSSSAIDRNFLKYALESKKRQMQVAEPAKLTRLTWECNEICRILNEGDTVDSFKLEKVHSQPKGGLLRSNSSFAGEFAESLVQLLYQKPMICGLSFANEEGSDRGEGGSLLASLAGSLPAWVYVPRQDTCEPKEPFCFIITFPCKILGILVFFLPKLSGHWTMGYGMTWVSSLEL